MLRSTGRFGRSDRLLLPRDFQRVGRQGTRAASRDVVMLVAPARGAPGGADPIRRLGITAGRKVGSAVQRNRIKRNIREWFRRARWKLEEDVEMVVIARAGASRLGARELGAQLSGLLDQIESQSEAGDG